MKSLRPSPNHASTINRLTPRQGAAARRAFLLFGIVSGALLVGSVEGVDNEIESSAKLAERRDREHKLEEEIRKLSLDLVKCLFNGDFNRAAELARQKRELQQSLSYMPDWLLEIERLGLLSTEKKCSVGEVERLELIGAERLRVAAKVCGGQGRYRESVRCFARSAEIFSRILGEDDASTINCIELQSRSLLLMDENDKAAKLAGSAYESLKRQLSMNNPALAENLSAVATAEMRLGNYVESQQMFERVLELRERGWGATSPPYASALRDAAELNFLTGDTRQARERLQKSMELMAKRKFPDDAEGLLLCQVVLAEVELAEGNAETASGLLEKIVATERAKAKPNVHVLKRAIQAQLKVLQALNHEDEARKSEIELEEIRRIILKDEG